MCSFSLSLESLVQVPQAQCLTPIFSNYYPQTSQSIYPLFSGWKYLHNVNKVQKRKENYRYTYTVYRSCAWYVTETRAGSCCGSGLLHRLYLANKPNQPKPTKGSSRSQFWYIMFQIHAKQDIIGTNWKLLQYHKALIVPTKYLRSY